MSVAKSALNSPDRARCHASAVRNNVASALCQMLTLYCRNLRQIQIAFGHHRSIEIIFLLRFPCKSCWATPPSLRLIAVRALFKWKTVALRHHGGHPSPPLLRIFLLFNKSESAAFGHDDDEPWRRRRLLPLADGSRSFAACFDYSASGRESLAPVPRHLTRQLSPVSAAPESIKMIGKW